VHEALELAHRPEQLVLVVGQGAAEPAEVLDGPVELRTLPAEVPGRGVEQVGERALLVGAVRAEGDAEVVEAGVDLVELQRDGRAVGVQRRPLASTGPPLYAGVSWTNRSPTIDGEMMTASAFAGSCTFAS